VVVEVDEAVLYKKAQRYGQPSTEHTLTAKQKHSLVMSPISL